MITTKRVWFHSEHHSLSAEYIEGKPVAVLYGRCDPSAELPEPIWTSLRLAIQPTSVEGALDALPRKLEPGDREDLLRRLELVREAAVAELDLDDIKLALHADLRANRVTPFVHPVSKYLLSPASSHACVKDALEGPDKGREACLRAAYAAQKGRPSGPDKKAFRAS